MAKIYRKDNIKKYPFHYPQQGPKKRDNPGRKKWFR